MVPLAHSVPSAYNPAIRNSELGHKLLSIATQDLHECLEAQGCFQGLTPLGEGLAVRWEMTGWWQSIVCVRRDSGLWTLACCLLYVL